MARNDERSTPAAIRSHYECPVCEFDDAEAGTGPWPIGDYWCPVCAEDNGRDVSMRRKQMKEMRNDFFTQ